MSSRLICRWRLESTRGKAAETSALGTSVCRMDDRRSRCRNRISSPPFLANFPDGTEVWLWSLFSSLDLRHTRTRYFNTANVYPASQKTGQYIPSQGSVAVHLRCDGIFKDYFTTVYFSVWWWNTCENWSILGEVIGKSKVSSVSDSQGQQQAQLMLRNPAWRDIIWTEEKYWQVIHRRTAVSYAEGLKVLAGRRVVQHCHCSAFYQTENF